MIAIWPAGDPVFCFRCAEGKHRIVDLDEIATNPLHYVWGTAVKCSAPDLVFEEEFKQRLESEATS